MKNEIEYFRRKLLSEIEEEKQMCPECYGSMQEGMCMECGYMEEKLVGGQKKLDVAPPFGKLTGDDFKKLGSKNEAEDHEVSMAHSSLEEIIKAAQELLMKLGSEERDIPGWVQDHITNAENYIAQAAKGFHELDHQEAPEEEDSFSSMMAEILAEAKSKKKKPVEKPTKKKKTK